ncbi:MAG TPA: GNAT family N-acetyltransferase [Candidatus Atribacteria bacterium]|nr:GNAT family N-acetyltransferase [Candidatus Atribacteria bacterium]
MHFRKAVKADIPQIMAIIGQTKAYLKSKGVDQWQDGYPDAGVIERDIENSNSYVLERCGSVVGTVAVVLDGDKNYEHIYEGRWLSNFPYAAIHRIAVSDETRGTGAASVMLENIEGLCRQKAIHSIRVDTHEDNRSMQGLLSKNGFQYRGIIYLEDGSKRLAYEKLI